MVRRQRAWRRWKMYFSREDHKGIWINALGGILSAIIIAVLSALWARGCQETPPFPTLPQPIADAPACDLPRPPATGVLPRRDANGRDVVTVLTEELAPDKHQLLCLWGPGGVGKTTLAAEAARRLCTTFAERVVWISADGSPDFSFSSFLDEVAKKLGHEELRQLALPKKEEAVRTLVVAKPTLIVLDNLETIEVNERIRCVEWLSQHVASPALLTSRQKVEGIQNIEIAAMAKDEAEIYLEKLIELEKPRAFTALDRGQLIETAGRNPLVLKWLVKQISEESDPKSVLQELARGKGDAARRVFDRSFQLPQMGDDGRAILMALSLFAPSASREAVAAVIGSKEPSWWRRWRQKLFGGSIAEARDDALARVNRAARQLENLAMLEVSPTDNRLAVSGLTRELAKAHLTSDPRADEFSHRFIAYFAEYAEAHGQPTPIDLNLLEAEKDNLLAAVDMAFTQQDWRSVIQLVYRFAVPTDTLLYLHGYWEETIHCLQQALKAAEHLAEMRDIAAFTHNLALLRQDRGEIAEARRQYEESLRIKRELGNQGGIASTLHQLGMIAHAQGDYAEARRQYEESLRIARELGNQGGIASTLHQLGMIAHDQGDYAEARRQYEESLRIKRELGDQRGIAISLHQLGMIAYVQGEYAEARRQYEESLRIKRELGDQSGIASTLHQLGMIAHDQGDYAEARRQYEESLRIARELGDQIGIASTLHQLGRLAEIDGDKKEAARLFQEALTIFEKLKSPDADIARTSLARVGGE